MSRLSGKVALISGAARGMGAAHARAVVAHGGQVVLGDILDEPGAALADELGDAAVYVPLDVRDPEAWSAAARTAEERFGGLHVLVNNAGIVNGNLLPDFELSEWQKIIDINLTGTFLGMRASVPLLRKSGGGSIVNISSVEGLRGSAGLHGYVATKFAVRGLTGGFPADPARPRRGSGGGVGAGGLPGLGRVVVLDRRGVRGGRRAHRRGAAQVLSQPSSSPAPSATMISAMAASRTRQAPGRAKSGPSRRAP